MTHIKLGGKQETAIFCNLIAHMEESRSLTVDADMATLRLCEQVKVPHGRSPVIRPNSDIDGLLECPMCQNSMYPPIQQVQFNFEFLVFVLMLLFDSIYNFLC